MRGKGWKPTLRLAGLAMLLSIGGAASASPAAAEPASGEAAAAVSLPEPADLLEPYYRELAASISLPAAAAGPALDRAAPLVRVALGSCIHQDGDQAIWSSIAATDPGVFVAMGDNIYGDDGYAGDAGMGSFVDAYRRFGAQPEFAAFRGQVPMLATWDDHDFGPNDSGGAFTFKRWSEQLFETFWHAGEAVRARPGVYDSVIVGPEGRRVQLILLDTRFFRSTLRRLPFEHPRTTRGSYMADESESADMLGAVQWAWLEEQLAKPAELRLVFSSIQVISDAHRFEKWGNMPGERQRLYRLIAGRAGGAVALLSGDRHSGALYRARPPQLGGDIWELTSSSLNLAFGQGDNGDREPDPQRQGGFFAQENFGLVDIDWSARTFALRLLDAQGAQLAMQRVPF